MLDRAQTKKGQRAGAGVSEFHLNAGGGAYPVRSDHQGGAGAIQAGVRASQRGGRYARSCHGVLDLEERGGGGGSVGGESDVGGKGAAIDADFEARGAGGPGITSGGEVPAARDAPGVGGARVDAEV